MLSWTQVSSIIPMHWGNPCVPNNLFVSYFTLFSVNRRSLALDPEKVAIAYKTLLIIAETDVLEIPKLFVVFLSTLISHATWILTDICLLRRLCFFCKYGCNLVHSSLKFFLNTRKSPFQSDSRTLRLLRLSHHASILPFFTQHDLRDFFFIKNLSFAFF